MKLGFGLYRHMLNAQDLRFARQCGATHIVAHCVDYFNKGGPDNARITQPIGGTGGWGHAGDPDRQWSIEELTAIKKLVNDHGMQLEAIENIDPAHWYDVLLDGPRKLEQLENLKNLVRNMGRVGIPCLGYNFSIAGVAARTKGPYARGDAESVGMEGNDDTPIPHGMVWNMIYDDKAPVGTLPSITHETLWQRLKVFLDALLPVAEEAGVTLAAHPDDPPMPTVRGTPRLVYQPHMYQRLLDIAPSPRNKLEFCLGSIAEMTEGDVHEAVEHYASQDALAYVHFRNVRGKVPTYKETFLDEGDIDMPRVMGILRKHRYGGVLIPDHTPLMACGAPWHAGMAYAMGYMRAAMQIGNCPAAAN